MFVLTALDLILPPFYLLLIYVIASNIQKKEISKNPLYMYYTRGLMVKLFGAITVCLIYQFYYSGGDTVNYFHTARTIINLAEKDFTAFYKVFIEGDNSPEMLTMFDGNTGTPEYWRDTKALFVSRLIIPFCLLGFKSFIPSAMLLAWVSYVGVWRLFLLFVNHFPMLKKQMAISVLFIPSVVFWGSGLLKDTITLSAIGIYSFHFYYFFINKKYRVSHILFILLASYLLISIKPYIFFALLPGSLIWMSNQRVEKVRSKLIKFIATPILVFLGVGMGLLILSKMGDALGVYAMDKVLDKALESNIDQKQEYYGGNSFDIGTFEPTIPGVLSKAHLAISATLFRPFIIEARNPVMFLSALENTYILILTVLLLFRLKFIGFFTFIGKNPLVLFSMMFALFFAFSVGLATSNFGSLVRLKIPCIPFFVSSLFVIRYLYEQKTKRKLGI